MEQEEGLLCSDRQWVWVGRNGISSPHDWEPNCPITGVPGWGHRPEDRFPHRVCEG